MTADLHPRTNEDVLEAVRWAAGEQVPLEIVGQGSKRALGKPMQTAHTLDVSGLSGITLFEPDELVLSAKAGTPLAEIEAALDEANQEMQFEAVDLAEVLGDTPGRGTLGGLVSTNFAGSRRLKAGSVRDHILGVSAVSGRGEAFKSGGRVVKNVTGYDLSKGLTGAWGTLAVLTDITMKVLPRAETEQTLVLLDISEEDATTAMAMALGSSAEVSGAAHMPPAGKNQPAYCMLRVEGFAPSVEARIKTLHALYDGMGEMQVVEEESSRDAWKSVRNASRFSEHLDRPLWRISCTPSEGWRVADAIRNGVDMDVSYDWQGGLLWVEIEDADPKAALVREALAAHGGGHATLIRATPEQRLAAPVFQPQPDALAALTRRYRENFDPHGVLNPGRMGG